MIPLGRFLLVALALPACWWGTALAGDASGGEQPTVPVSRSVLDLPERHLPDAVTWVGKDELRHCLVPEPFERLGYADKVFHRPDSAYRWLEGDEVDFADGIRLLFTPGHTVGHYSLVLEREGSAPMLFPADVTYTRETSEKELISGFHNDPTANFVSLRKVKHLAERLGADVFFTHDMEAWESYKHAPDHY